MTNLTLIDASTGECAAPAVANFDDFWLLYPRRVARKDAFKAWHRLTPAQQLQAMVAIVAWRKEWAKREIEFVPHAATWLNGWRFDDELPVAPSSGAASHQPAQLPEQGAKTEMPQHVRDLIAKMKGRK